MHNYVVFTSNPQYAPAQHFINLLTVTDKYRVRGIKKPNAIALPSIADTVEWSSAKSTSLLEVKNIFQGCDTACMFVMPTDIRQVTQMTHSFIDAAAEAGVRRLAWLAPASPTGSDLGKRLAEAEALVRSASIKTLVLRHAPLFSDLLDHKKELKFRRTLSLPLGNNALPWIAPEIIAQGLYKWVQGEVNNEPPEVLTGAVQLTGDNIAQEISTVLKQNLDGYKFAQRLFAAVDVDSSGEIDPQEIFPYLLKLGYSNDEASHIEVFLRRWQEVKASIEQTGTYEQTYDELTYGARLAWRNSSRCIGRYFWQSLYVRDMRHLETEEEMFQAILEHIKYGTNEGDVRATMTVFKADGRQLWNAQLLRYAGYRQPDGTILGDPANVELTEYTFKMGWSSPHPKTPFDYLPIIIQLPGKQPKWFDIPPEVILDVPLEHPRYTWFAEFGLKWYALPAVSNMVFDIGGIQYICAPFNGFYMGTEIGGRNFSDTYRYNMLPKIAEKMGLDTSDDSTLWKDSALVELNIAVVHSFKKHNIRLIDHHAMSDYFIKFINEEKRCGRSVYADWGWIIPPVSGSTSKAWSIEMENRILKPNYFYPKHRTSF